jgi:hypothetical protein
VLHSTNGTALHHATQKLTEWLQVVDGQHSLASRKVLQLKQDLQESTLADSPTQDMQECTD